MGGSLLFGLSLACSILSWLGRGSQASSASAGHPGQPAAQSRAMRLLHWRVPVFQPDFPRGSVFTALGRGVGKKCPYLRSPETSSCGLE